MWSYRGNWVLNPVLVRIIYTKRASHRAPSPHNTLPYVCPWPTPYPLSARDQTTAAAAVVGCTQAFLECRTNTHSNRPQAVIIITNYLYFYYWWCKVMREQFTPYQSKDSSPTIPTYRKKEVKRKTKDKERVSRLCQTKSIIPALETRQSHTIEYWSTRSFLPQRHRGISAG